MAQSPLQIIMQKALGVVNKGKQAIIESQNRKRELKQKAITGVKQIRKKALGSVFGQGVVEDVYTKANQIVDMGKQALVNKVQTEAQKPVLPFAEQAKKTLITDTGKTITAIPKAAKVLAQGIGYGAGFLTKSAIQAIGGDKLREKYDNPEMETILFGRPTSTLQDFSKRTGEYAESKGSTKRQKFALQSLAVAGSLFAENPLNFSKTPVKATLATLAKESNEQIIKQTLKKSIPEMPDEIIDVLAPRIAKAKDEKAVQAIFDGATSKVRPEVSNRSFSEVNTNKIKDETISGKREDFRLDNPKQLERSLPNLPKDSKPDTMVTVYRASDSPIKNGDHITLSKVNAEKYIGQRPGAKLQSIEVPLKDLVKSNGIGNEFIFSPKVIKKEVKQVDRLIAEGKIRVVSRDGRDVYQTKQGGEWVNARDEDSAVAKVTKVSEKKPKVELPEKIEQEKMLIEYQKEELARDPAKELTKYINKRTGELPEVGAGKGVFGKKGDEMAVDLGFKDSEEAREAAQNYLKRKAQILADEKALKAQIKEVKKQSPIEIIAKKQTAKTKISPEEAKSIEQMAQQAKEIMDSDFRRRHDVSLPTIVKQTVTPVTRKVHLIDTMLTTPKFVMEKIGFGKEAVQLRRAMDSYWKELPKNLDVITDWSKRVPAESNAKIFKYLDGQKVNLTPKELEVAGEIKVWLRGWADRLGLPEDRRVTDYITRLFDDGNKKEFDEELAKIIADKIPGSVYSPFTLKRLGAKGYKEDTWQALDAYVKRSTRKVHMDPVLERIQQKAGSSLEFSNIEESQFRYIQKYIENINMRPTEMDKSIDNFIKNIPGIGDKFGQRPVTEISRFFRRLTYRGMLGLNPGSAIRNLSQGINTYATLGEKYTIIGYAKLFNKGAMKELTEEGVLNAGFIQDRVLSATKKKMQMLDKGLFAMFETVERINRGAAYFGAKSKALKQGKSLEEAIEYAKDVVRKTQFVFDSVDSPVGMSSDIMKTLFQFQTFTTKQSEFLLQMAKNKDIAGLARYAIAGLAFVYTIGQAIGMEPKEILPMYRFQTPPSLKFPVEVAKAGLDAPDKYGKDRTFSTKLEDVGKSAIGLFPGGTQIKKTIEGIRAIRQGGSFDKAGRLQFEIGESKKDKIQAILFGKYTDKAAKEYFKGLETPKEKPSKQTKKLYEAIQEIKANDPARAIETYRNLSDEEKNAYQAYKKIVETKKKIEIKKEIFPVFQEIRNLKDEGKEQEALDKYKALTEEEKEVYQSIKKSFDKAEKEAEKEIQAERSLVKLFVDYARAYAIDPSNAFKAMTTKEKLGKVEGGLVGFQRFFGKQFNEPGGSEEYVYKLLAEMGIPASERSNYNLEHIVPLTAGGDNSPDNLKIVDRETHNSWTEIDIAIGKALKEKKINRKRAEKISIDFKSGLINKEEVYKLLR